ncbi:inorganic diphosphatase [Dyella jejuensis]|uniref:Inorganic pyrophosphatase n=1 Tax=Dyella jejuensis TaxID=1432009 RepID=A0ABW8JIU0_9GAMM
MALDKVSPGPQVPDAIHAIIEIPMDAEPVKYEVDKATGAIFVDRVLSTPMRYPCNYGYMPGTLCGDGDPLDVLIVMPMPLIPGSVIVCRPLGVMDMTDENGEDTKLIAVPVTRTFAGYAHWEKLSDVPETTRGRIQHFFEHYKDLEKGKWVRFEGWRDVGPAREEVLACIDRYQAYLRESH